VVICLDRGADLHMVQLMPLPLTVSCFSKIQIGFTFLVPADLGSPAKRAVKRVCAVYDILRRRYDSVYNRGPVHGRDGQGAVSHIMLHNVSMDATQQPGCSFPS